MTIPPETRFRNAVAANLLASPGNFFFPGEVMKLVRLAADLGIPEADARQVITSMVERPRHRITAGIE
ncbi:hypothetical protein [Paracoccus sp. IB05]|uniref:hypothetical protein n=1 Tax=Paracoccus sp. IB05 TaxID=2779367 RepID=UPI0018E85343|nr:hypothetical protein [Paracoccus sp. IB05]MBJ2150663.1 hypothetical protein [Paracoccus sp. IB05]